MSESVTVFNAGQTTYVEDFRDNTIVIEPGQSKPMSRAQAVMFLGTNPGMNPKTGQFIVKNLEIRSIDGSKPPTGEAERREQAAHEYKCHLDGQVFATKEELDVHLASHQNQLIKDEPKPTTAGVACPICNKVFANAAGIRSHMSVHVREDDEAKKG